MAESNRAPSGRGKQAAANNVFSGYNPLESCFDELFGADGAPQSTLGALVNSIDSIGAAEFKARQKLANAAFLKGGITFKVYSDKRGEEKIFPFDLIPRPVSGNDWPRLERGLTQRIRALNMFLADVYGEQRLLKENVIPRELVEGSKGFLKQVKGIKPLNGVYVHVAGIDLIRRPDGSFCVLEDNIRTPSGVSYVLENRRIMKRVFPKVFTQAKVRNVDEYPLRLREALTGIAPEGVAPRLLILTPGPFNSAYFEHSFLARSMGCELVQGQDLFVWQDKVFVKTTKGPQRVGVIYRRVDDQFMDPKVFRPDSLLGVPGIMGAYAKGNVALANAIGNGVADDKAVYPYVPDMIRFYLSEEPILDQVETFICARDKDREHVLANLSNMVVKSVDESGGYGMLMGPQATRKERDAFAEQIRANPRGYIAQPRVEFSTCPTWSGSDMQPRRVDLRPYIVTGKDSWVLPGGLTRVALVEGSYVVNSSQGGGSKDTWVMG